MAVLLLANALVGAPARASAQVATPDEFAAPTGHVWATPLLHERVRLHISGNSRFATELEGRDTVLRHLAALRLFPDAYHQSEGPYILAAGELVWLARPTLPSSHEVTPVLVLVRTDSTGAAIRLTVLFADDEQVARRFPRDDGIVRISLAEKRNRLAVARLHGQSAPLMVLAADRERVFVTVPPTAAATGPERTARRLVAYTFDAAGTVRSVIASPPHSFAPLSLLR